MAIVGRHPGSPRRGRYFNTSVMSLILIYSLLPILYLVVASTKTSGDLFTTFGLLPSRFNLFRNLADLATYQGGIFFRWFANTIVYSCVSASGATLMCALAAYSFAKYSFAGKRLIHRTILAALMVPQTVLAIPIFLMLAKVHMVNSPWSVMLPMMVYVPGVFLMQVYIDQNVPNELIEAARIDGADEIRIFRQIAFRLMAPGLATVFLLAFVQTWNTYFVPLVVLNSPAEFPITVGLSDWYAVANNADGGTNLFTIILTGALVSILPVVSAFLVMQRFWESGLTAGAIK